MSNAETDSSCSNDSDDSETNYLPEYLLEVEGQQDDLEQDTSVSTRKGLTAVDYCDVFQPYTDEPIASEEWLEEYRSQQEIQQEFERKLQSRSYKMEDLNLWCKCGNCQTEYLQNPNEYQCCLEIEECVESLSSDIVREECIEIPDCITLHPGFEQVCLSKWSLRLAADKYKTKVKSRYSQTGSEERFLRSIAYREFTRLVHGYFGVRRRIPLPACAYNKIREKFNDNEYIGFEVEEIDE